MLGDQRTKQGKGSIVLIELGVFEGEVMPMASVLRIGLVLRPHHLAISLASPFARVFGGGVPVVEKRQIRRRYGLAAAPDRPADVLVDSPFESVSSSVAKEAREADDNQVFGSDVAQRKREPVGRCARDGVRPPSSKFVRYCLVRVERKNPIAFCERVGAVPCFGEVARPRKKVDAGPFLARDVDGPVRRPGVEDDDLERHVARTLSMARPMFGSSSRAMIQTDSLMGAGGRLPTRGIQPW